MKNIGTLVTAKIKANDSLDLIATFDANDGMGGHQGYATLSDMYSIILARRDWGMFASVYNDGANNAVYQLIYNQNSTDLSDNLNWVVFQSANNIATGIAIKYNIQPSEVIIVPTYSQYLLYGNLTIQGELINYGQVVLINGSLVMSYGTFSNYGLLLMPQTGPAPNALKFSSAFSATAGVTFSVDHFLSTDDFVYSIKNNNLLYNSATVSVVNLNTVSVITNDSFSSGTINIIGI